MPPLNILIVGSSIAGPTLATLLLLTDLPASEKPQITLLERASSPRKEGQNIDIRGAGLTIMRHMGIELAVRRATTHEKGVRLVDERDRIWAEVPADPTGATSTPTADVEILRGTLAGILLDRMQLVSKAVQAAGGAGVEVLFGDRLDRIEQDGDGVTVHLARSNETRRFDLVVGADGVQSTTRRMVWGTEGEAQRVEKVAGGVYGAFFSGVAGAEHGLWRRWFHAPGRRAVMVRPSESRERMSVFMTVVNDRDARLPAVVGRRGQDVQAQKELMKEYFQDAGWQCDRILGEMMTTDDFYYDMLAQVKMDKWSNGRVVLLGDAGYCASPFSGMGTTLAMTGAWNLAGAILRHVDDYGTAFTEYEEKMRPVVGRAQKLAPGMPRQVHPETAWGVWILNAIAFFMDISGLISLLLRMGAGPPAHFVAVEDYGFRRLEETE